MARLVWCNLLKAHMLPPPGKLALVLSSRPVAIFAFPPWILPDIEAVLGYNYLFFCSDLYTALHSAGPCTG